MRWARFTTSAGLLLALGATLAGCGQSDEAKAQEYAVDACDITFDDSGPVFDDKNNVIDPATMEFSRLERFVDIDVSNSTAASAAAQLDSSWATLAAAASDVAVTSEKALQVRRDGAMNSDFWDQFTDAEKSQHNSGGASWRVECRALVARLSN